MQLNGIHATWLQRTCRPLSNRTEQLQAIRAAIEEDRFEEFRRDFFNRYDMSRNF